jgi:hypothetical protein
MSIGYYKFIYLFITSYIIIKKFILFLLSKYHTKITNNIYHNKIYKIYYNNQTHIQLQNKTIYLYFL